MKKITLTALGLVLALAAGRAFAAEEMKMPPKGEPHGGHMFKEADADKDGAISKDEWRAKGDKMFDKMDTDHDGKLSHDEMKAHHETMRAEHEKHKAERMEKMEEHKGMMKEHMEKKAASDAEKK